jgi:hypothetical protein
MTAAQKGPYFEKARLLASNPRAKLKTKDSRKTHPMLSAQAGVDRSVQIGPK